jgi:acetyltransferase-like isoleucine patch superfamily enzyme
MNASIKLRQWVKRRDDPLADLAYRCVKAARELSMPTIPVLHRTLFALHATTRNTLAGFLRVFWYTPLFQSRLVRPAPRLYLYGGLPMIMGPLDLEIGAATRISAQTTFTGRTAGAFRPHLRVGGNVDIGWQTTIAVGRKVIIGDNVRIAGRALLAGYPGHPLDPIARAAGFPDTEDQVGDIVLEDDVWLATGVTVSAGVRIGRGTVVAAGSVVTKDLPPHVLAGGVPARVIRQLPAVSGESA